MRGLLVLRLDCLFRVGRLCRLLSGQGDSVWWCSKCVGQVNTVCWCGCWHLRSVMAVLWPGAV